MPVPAARLRCGQRARRGMLLVPGVTRFVASVAPRTGRGQRALPFAFSGGEGARWPEEPRHGRCSPRTASPLLFPGTGVVCRPCPSSPHPRGRDPPGPIPPSSPVWGLSAPKRDPGRGGGNSSPSGGGEGQQPLGEAGVKPPPPRCSLPRQLAGWSLGRERSRPGCCQPPLQGRGVPGRAWGRRASPSLPYQGKAAGKATA